jgi:hypothetical protein
LWPTSSTASSVVHICGDITSNATWASSSAKAYIIDCNTTIKPGRTVTIQPGTIVKASSFAGLNVQGSLVGSGTAASPVVFTSLRDDTAGGDTNSDGSGTLPAKSDWAGISESPASGGGAPSASLDHALVSYASTPVSVSSASSASVTNSTLRHAGSARIQVSSTPAVTVRGNTVDDVGSTGIAVFMDQADTTHAPTVSNNAVTGSGDRAVVVWGSHLLPAQMTGNTGSSNSVNAIEVAGRLAGNLTLP